MLVIVGVFGISSTNNSLKLSERAWLGSSAALVGVQPTAGQPLRYALLFNNSGKEPATDLNFSQDSGTIEAPANDDFGNVQVSENATCTGLDPKDGGGVVLPNGGVQRGVDTARGQHPVIVNDDILQGRHYVYTQGCVAYRTFGETHRTAYCYIYQIKPLPAIAAPVTQPAATQGGQPAAGGSPNLLAAGGATINAAVTAVQNCPNGNKAD